MKIVFDRNNLINALTPAMCAVSNKNTIPAVEGILFTAADGDNKCMITTFDTEKGVRTSVAAQITEGGSYIINAQKIYSMIKSFDGEEVTMTIDSKMQVTVESGNSVFHLHCLSGEDFPNLPTVSYDNGFVIRQGLLHHMIGQVAHAVAVNDQRIMLTGCFFKVDSEWLTLVACDSFVLAKCTRKVACENLNANGTPLDFKFIIPGRTLSELQRLLGEDEEVSIYPTQKHIGFIIRRKNKGADGDGQSAEENPLGDIMFFSRLIDNKYIDYDRIILRNHRIFTITNRAELLGSLERAALITEDKQTGSTKNHVKFSIIGDNLEISSVSATGQVRDSLEVDHRGDDIVIGFNNRFLIETLRACDTEQIMMSMTTESVSVNIEPAVPDESSGYIYMILPVRMKEG